MMDWMSNFVQTLKKLEKRNLHKSSNQSMHNAEKGVVLPVIFSDSILFISRSNSIYDAQKQMYIASYFLYHTFRAGIPTKGAIAYGTFTADFKKSNFFGRPLIDAYLLAEEVDFYGAIYHHTFENYMKDKKESFPSAITGRKTLPLKSGRITHTYATWDFHNDSNDTKQYIVGSFYNTVSGKPRKYVDNSIDVYCTETQKSKIEINPSTGIKNGDKTATTEKH
jgi:hypothetical protein